MSEEKTGVFKVVKVTDLKDIALKGEGVISESDVAFQTSNDKLIQFVLDKKEEKKRKVPIKPGCWSLQETNAGLILESFELKNYNLLTDVTTTSRIMGEANKFFSRLDVYKELQEGEPKRAILLASVPGVGKTASINEVCKTFLKEEGTAVVIWDTSSIKSQSVNQFFLNQATFPKELNRIIFVMEDVGGGNVENYGGSRSVDSAMLQLLDGVGRPFGGVPTFIIATTNNPEQAVASLIDRPGRFDKVMELDTPNTEETKKLLAFIVNRELNEEEQEAAEKASASKFSIAHLKEVVVRSKLDDISLLEAVEQLIEHKERCKDAFSSKSSRIGIGMFD